MIHDFILVREINKKITAHQAEITRIRIEKSHIANKCTHYKDEIKSLRNKIFALKRDRSFILDKYLRFLYYVIVVVILFFGVGVFL